MYAVMGATGHVGRAVVQTLQHQGVPVRAITRSSAKARGAFNENVELVEAEASDARALARAFSGTSGVFVMNPPDYTSGDMLAAARNVIQAALTALEQCGTSPVVMLSSVGSQHQSGQGNIATTAILERATEQLGALTTLRAAWFMENWSGSLSKARDNGVLPGFLTPLGRRIPMVASADIGRIAAELLLDGDVGRRLVELHGPEDYAPADVAKAAAKTLARPVQAVEIPRASWPGVLGGMGLAADSANWSEMFDGFNSGWLSFENNPEIEQRRGEVTLDAFVGGDLNHG